MRESSQKCPVLCFHLRLTVTPRYIYNCRDTSGKYDPRTGTTPSLSFLFETPPSGC